MSKEAMKLALEALKQIDEAMPFPVAKFAQAALREALAEQPSQQEPVAKKKHEPKIDLGKYAGTYGGYITPESSEGYLEKAYRLANELRSHLSIAPAQRKPLTDEEIWKFWWSRPEVPDGEDDSMEAEFVAAVRAVLAAHGIKENKK